MERKPARVCHTYGRIVDAKTGLGIKRLELFAEWGDEKHLIARTYTDSDKYRPAGNGKFDLGMLYAGRVSISVIDMEKPARYATDSVRLTIKVYDMADPDHPTEKTIEAGNPFELDIPDTKMSYSLRIELEPLPEEDE